MNNRHWRTPQYKRQKSHFVRDKVAFLAFILRNPKFNAPELIFPLFQEENQKVQTASKD
jgi:hypothetical protein